MTFPANLTRLAPNEPNLSHLLNARIDAMEWLGVLSKLSSEHEEIGTMVVEINYYIAVLEATLINWLNLQETKEIQRDLSKE